MGKQFSNVSSKYGAPMGRRRLMENPTGKVRIFRVKFVDGDYDDGGAYWGGGPQSKPLFCIRGEGVELFYRASCLDDAIAQCLKDHRDLTFTHVDTGRKKDFIEGYIEAALADINDRDREDGKRKRYRRRDLSKSLRATIKAECMAFWEHHKDEIGTWEGKESPDARAGADFYLTRVGAGAGFLDGDWEEQAGERMTRTAKSFFSYPNFDVSSDGKIYGD